MVNGPSHHYSNLSNRTKRLSENKNKHNHVRRKMLLCLLIKNHQANRVFQNEAESWECWVCWRGDLERGETWRLTLTLKLRSSWSLAARWEAESAHHQWSGGRGGGGISSSHHISPQLWEWKLFHLPWYSVHRQCVVVGAQDGGGGGGGGGCGGWWLVVCSTETPDCPLLQWEWDRVTCTNIGASILVVWPLLSEAEWESAVTDPILQYTDTRPS